MGQLKVSRIAFVWALLIFALLNFGLSSFKFFKDEDKNSLYQAFNSAREQFLPINPQIVLVGSSLVMTPEWTADLHNYQNVQNFYLHHSTLHLNALLSRYQTKLQSFNFALPGAMVSDVYLLTEKLLKGAKTPKIIIYGLAPRDFMDDLLTGETRTFIFQKLSEISDLFSQEDLYLSTWQEKLDFALNNSLFLYGKRYRYQQKLEQITLRLKDKFFPRQENLTAAISQAPVGAMDLGMSIYANRAQVWRKSIEEYTARYHTFNDKQFNKQCRFLKAFLNIAQKRKISIILVNMPLSQDNLALMPDNFYNRYKQALYSLAGEFGVPVLDIGTDNSYNKSCFLDTAHLNARGGEKFNTNLAQYIHNLETKQSLAFH